MERTEVGVSEVRVGPDIVRAVVASGTLAGVLSAHQKAGGVGRVPVCDIVVPRVALRLRPLCQVPLGARYVRDTLVRLQRYCDRRDHTFVLHGAFVELQTCERTCVSTYAESE